MSEKDSKVWRHTAQVQRMFGQTESIALTLTFDTVEQLAELVDGLDEKVFTPRQKAVEDKIDELNRKVLESQQAKKGK